MVSRIFNYWSQHNYSSARHEADEEGFFLAFQKLDSGVATSIRYEENDCNVDNEFEDIVVRWGYISLGDVKQTIACRLTCEYIELSSKLSKQNCNCSTSCSIITELLLTLICSPSNPCPWLNCCFDTFFETMFPDPNSKAKRYP